MKIKNSRCFQCWEDFYDYTFSDSGEKIYLGNKYCPNCTLKEVRNMAEEITNEETTEKTPAEGPAEETTG